MKKARCNKSLSIWIIWIVTCVTLLALPFCVNLVEYSVFNERFNEQIAERNIIVLNSMCDKIDEQLIFAESLSTNLSLNDEVNKIINEVSLPLDAKERYMLYQFVNDFNFGYMQVDYQGRIFIYFKNIDIVAKGGSIQSLKSFYQTFISGKPDMENFLRIMNEENPGKYFLVDFNGKKNEIFYVKSISKIEDESVVNIILQIDKEKIAKDVSELYLAHSGQLIVLDDQDNIMLKIGNLDFQSGNEKIEVLLKRDDILSYQIKSHATNWKYVYLLPKTEAYKEINHSKSLIIFLAITVLLVCTFIVILFFKTNYSKINDLLKLFKYEKKNLNEYSFLKEKIEHMLSENKNFSDALSSQNSYFEERALIALLEEWEITGEYIKKGIDNLLFDFEKDSFIVVLFSFDFEKQENSPREFVIKNVFSELLDGRGYHKHMLKYKNSLVYIIASEDENLKENVSHDLNYTYNFVSENLGFHFYGVMGSKRQKENGIAYSYKEAYRTLEFCIITGEKSIAEYDSVCSLFKKNYFYSHKTGERLITLIQVNDQEKLHRELDEIFKENELNGRLNVNSMRYLVIEFASAIKELLKGNGIAIQQVFAEEWSFINNIFTCNSMSEMKEVVFLLYESCYDRVFAELNPVQDLTDKIVSFIEQNYQKQTLGIQMIADEFELSNDYIARKFKAKMHMKINDYINLVRVNEAKKYLSETNDLISSISNNVGFTNYRTFVRVFTNVTGISPKQYRDTNI